MMNQLDPKNRFSMGGSLSAIALASLAILLPACSEPTVNNTPQTEQNVSTEEISTNAENLIGQTVTVRGEVEDVGDRSSFTLNDNRFFGGENILVINATGQPFVIPADDDMAVQVTGEVRQFTLVDVEREYNLDLDPTYYTEYEQKPAIVAQSLALAPDPGEITENPSRFYGQTVAIEAEIEEVLGANAFTLDEEEIAGSTDLLVVNAAITPTIKDGERVVVTGQVRPFVLAEIDRDYDLTWDLDFQRELEAEYSSKPVLMSTGVYPSAAVQ